MRRDGSDEQADPTSRDFQDAKGRKWRVSLKNADGARVLEFTCLDDAREPHRVIAAPASQSVTSITESDLRERLNAAPSLGRLTE